MMFELFFVVHLSVEHVDSSSLIASWLYRFVVVVVFIYLFIYEDLEEK